MALRIVQRCGTCGRNREAQRGSSNSGTDGDKGLVHDYLLRCVKNDMMEMIG